MTRLRSPWAGSSSQLELPLEAPLRESPRLGTHPGTRPKRTILGPALMSLTSTFTPWSARVRSTCLAICWSGSSAVVRGSAGAKMSMDGTTHFRPLPPAALETVFDACRGLACCDMCHSGSDPGAVSAQRLGGCPSCSSPCGDSPPSIPWSPPLLSSLSSPKRVRNFSGRCRPMVDLALLRELSRKSGFRTVRNR